MVSSQMVPVGRLQVATPRSMALAVRGQTDAQAAVDERVSSVTPGIIASDPTVAAAAEAAVDGAVAGLSLVKTSLLVTNYALNPVPSGAAWQSENTALYQSDIGTGETIVTRLAASPSGNRAVMRNIGMLTATQQTYPAGDYTVSVEVWADAAANVTAYGAFGATSLPSQTWTTVYGTMTSTGAAMYGPNIAITAPAGNAATGAVTKFRNAMIAKGTTPVQPGNGTTPGWQWNGTPHQSTSSGLPVTAASLAAETQKSIDAAPLVKRDVLSINYALNPVPGSLNGWVSENTGLYVPSLGTDELIVTRTATSPSGNRAVMRKMGMLTSGTEVYAAGPWTVSVEVWVDTTARVIAYGTFPAQKLTTGQWTRVYGSFTSTGAAMYGASIAVQEDTGLAPTGAVTKFRNLMLAPGTIYPRPGTGKTLGWQWNGVAHQSTSAGLPVTAAGQASDLSAVRGGVRLVSLGDSTTIANSTVVPSWGGRDFWAWAQILSGGAFKFVRNAGIAGDKSTDMLARFERDVTPYAPTVVPIIAGINDAVGGVTTLAEYQANIREIVRRVRRIGATPWLGTVAPNLNTGAVQQRIAAFNAWLREYSATEGIPLIDVNGVLTDPATGKYLPAYDLDGTHQNVAGAKAIARDAILPVLRKNLPAWSPNLPTSNTADQKNLVSNGLFLTGSPIPDNWTATAGTPSVVADPLIKGNWFRLADSAAGVGVAKFVSADMGGAAAGDLLSFVGRIHQVKGTSSTTVEVSLTYLGANVVHNVLWLNTEDIEPGVFALDTVVPAGATSVQVQIKRNVTAAGTGYTELAQVGLFNQTSLGATV